MVDYLRIPMYAFLSSSPQRKEACISQPLIDYVSERMSKHLFLMSLTNSLGECKMLILAWMFYSTVRWGTLFF
jgi:hypothetical protein